MICYLSGHPVSRGDIVRMLGFDPGEFTFEVRDWRPEGVAVIKNLADGFDYTSTVPVDQLVLVRRGDQCRELSPTGKQCRVRGEHYWHEASTGAGSESWQVKE